MRSLSGIFNPLMERKRSMRCLSSCGLALLSFFLPAAIHVNGAQPGEDPFSIRWHFEKSSDWLHPAAWPGKTQLDTGGNARSGKSCLALESTANGDNVEGRVFLRISQYRIGTVPGRRFLIRVFVKGSGDFRLGIVQTRQKNGRRITGRTTGQRHSATSNYAEYSYSIDLTDSPDTVLIQPLIVLESQGRILIDDAEIREVPPDDFKLAAETPHLIIPRDQQEIAIRFNSEKKNREISLYQFIDGECVSSRKSPSGEIVFPVQNIPAESCMVRAAALGNTVDVWISRISDAQYRKLDALASRVRMRKPLHVLFLGDSISDFLRGHNYIDKLAFWLNRRNPGMFSFRNAAVHGDFITRTLQRLKGMTGKPKAFKQYRYDGLWNEKYDLVYIWLGHNDTVSNTTWDKTLKKPRISPELQKKAYTQVIDEIRKHTRARIILVSAASLNEPVCIRQMRSMKRPDGLKYLFGRPELLEEWNRNLRQIAMERKVNCLDLYDALKNHPEKDSLFSQEDGVHPVEKGHDFLAGLFLRDFAEKGWGQ